jgi:hypothetical protein
MNPDDFITGRFLLKQDGSKIPMYIYKKGLQLNGQTQPTYMGMVALVSEPFFFSINRMVGWSMGGNSCPA